MTISKPLLLVSRKRENICHSVSVKTSTT